MRTRILALFTAVVSGTSVFAGWGLPPVGSVLAPHLDALYIFLTLLSLFFFVLVVGLMGYFVVKYRERPGQKTTYIHGHIPLEIFWTAVPTAIVMVIFVWGYAVYREMITPVTGAVEIKVVGKQWSWKFQYEDGRTSDNEIFVPVNKPVRLVMSSEDVLHGFFVPDFRVKRDVVPGMYSYLNFEATVPGEHQVFCTEYCGGSHSQMLAKLYALTPEQWKLFERGHAWKDIQKATAEGKLEEMDAIQVAQAAPTHMSALAMQGQGLVTSKGCIACHSADSPGVGPSYRGVYMTERELEGGKKVVADENYLRESIEFPMAKRVKGFGGTMPTYKGQVSETVINAIVAYLKSLK